MKLHCKIGNKWCKFCRQQKFADLSTKAPVCTYCNKALGELTECPRIAEIKTKTFSEILHEVEFYKVFKQICDWWPNQCDCEHGYKIVFNKVRAMVPNPVHKLDDMFISIVNDEWEGKLYPNVSGIQHNRPDISYGIEFEPWIDWVSHFITKETLNTFTPTEIAAACLWEMTFNGFEESVIQGTLEKMKDDIDKIKKQSA